MASAAWSKETPRHIPLLLVLASATCDVSDPRNGTQIGDDGGRSTCSHGTRESVTEPLTQVASFDEPVDWAADTAVCDALFEREACAKLQGQEAWRG